MRTDYDFAALAKVARREVSMRKAVYGKKVAAQQMEPDKAESMTQEMVEIAEILEALAEWKAKKQAQPDVH